MVASPGIVLVNRPGTDSSKMIFLSAGYHSWLLYFWDEVKLH